MERGKNLKSKKEKIMYDKITRSLEHLENAINHRIKLRAFENNNKIRRGVSENYGYASEYIR